MPFKKAASSQAEALSNKSSCLWLLGMNCQETPFIIIASLRSCRKHCSSVEPLLQAWLLQQLLSSSHCLQRYCPLYSCLFSGCCLAPGVFVTITKYSVQHRISFWNIVFLNSVNCICMYPKDNHVKYQCYWDMLAAIGWQSDGLESSNRQVWENKLLPDQIEDKLRFTFCAMFLYQFFSFFKIL